MGPRRRAGDAMIRSAIHSSYPRIGDATWDQQLRRVARERERGEAGEEEVRRVEDDVASLVVAEQSRAFLPVVTGPVARRAPVTVRDAVLALEVNPRGLKAVLTGPVTLARIARDLHYGD